MQSTEDRQPDAGSQSETARLGFAETDALWAAAERKYKGWGIFRSTKPWLIDQGKLWSGKLPHRMTLVSETEAGLEDAIDKFMCRLENPGSDDGGAA